MVVVLLLLLLLVLLLLLSLLSIAQLAARSTHTMRLLICGEKGLAPAGGGAREIDEGCTSWPGDTWQLLARVERVGGWANQRTGTME